MVGVSVLRRLVASDDARTRCRFPQQVRDLADAFATSPRAESNVLPLSDGMPARRFPIVDVSLIVFELPHLNSAVFHATFYPCTVSSSAPARTAAAWRSSPTSAAVRVAASPRCRDQRPGVSSRVVRGAGTTTAREPSVGGLGPSLATLS
jgi:hypothetical protein